MAISMGNLIKSGTVAWKLNDAANTQKVVSIAAPDVNKKQFLLVVYNPSTETDITVKVISPRTIAGGTRNILLQQLTFMKKQTLTGTAIDGQEQPFQFAFTNSSLNLVFSNDTGGTLAAFTLNYELYEL